MIRFVLDINNLLASLIQNILIAQKRGENEKKNCKSGLILIGIN